MIDPLINWFKRVFGKPPELAPAAWRQALRQVRGTRHLSAAEQEQLAGLVREFLHLKKFVLAPGFELSEQQRLVIAVQACIPVLHLGLRAYRRFHTVYVFPGAFRERGARAWRPGQAMGHLAGLAIQGGGVALAWSESRLGVEDEGDGYNPIIHEFAHQLDMIDGAADGRPELPPGVSGREWFETFSSAFTDFEKQVEEGQETAFSDYAATNPAEFFAVVSEVYFEDPEVLREEYPGVYRLLNGFYRQVTVG